MIEGRVLKKDSNTNSIHAILCVPDELRTILQALPKAAVGFSGGVDSSYLLYAAKTCGVDLGVYYVQSQFQPSFELEDAKRLVRELDMTMKVIELDVLSQEMVKKNPDDRCYHCKNLVFQAIAREAERDGFSLILDGSNASDEEADRPGMKALKELQVRSPLREAGLSKDQIRQYSKLAKLFTWDKPAYACLATRVPIGRVLEREILKNIEAAEEKLRSMGFTDLRVRILEDSAKLQLPFDQMQKAIERREELLRALSPWFSDVVLDLKAR